MIEKGELGFMNATVYDLVDFLKFKLATRRDGIGVQLGLGQYKSLEDARYKSGQYSMLNEMINVGFDRDLKEYLKMAGESEEGFEDTETNPDDFI